MRLLGALLLATNGSLAAVFILMWFTGDVTVCEPNPIIRGVELAVALGVAAVGARAVAK